MRALDKIRLRLRSLFARQNIERELDDELRFHLEQLIQEELAAGVPPREAHKSALRKMGGVSQFQEACRDMRRLNLIDDFKKDLRYAGRSLRRNPGFAALAVLVMALGIGANTAVFSVVNAVLLRPLAYRDPDRIVTLSGARTSDADGGAHPPHNQLAPVSGPDFLDWHDRSSSFEAMAYYRTRETSVMRGSTAEYAQVTMVSAEFFSVFAVEPLVGQFPMANDVEQGSRVAVMISHDYWQGRFGGDPRVVGQRIRMEGQVVQIAGVLPPRFRFPAKTDFWLMIPRRATNEYRAAHNYLAVGRLKPGVSLDRAQSEMTSITRSLEQQYPGSNKGQGVAVERMRDQMVGDVRLTLYLLLGAVSVVLLIACANTATLLLGKATTRTREIAVRVALGAGRRRIMRQVVTESLLLAVLAAVAGLLLAYLGSKALVAMAPADLPRLAETGIDRSVLAFTLGISLTTSFLFGMVPALYASRLDVNDALKQGGTRSVIGGGLTRIRGALVVAEVALAVVLLCGAGLLIKSFIALNSVALGFRPDSVLVIKATVPRAGAQSQGRRESQNLKEVLSQFAALPGVVAAGATLTPPGQVGAFGSHFAGYMPAKLDYQAPNTVLSIVAPGTFAALGIPLMSGRDFNDGDTFDKTSVAVVNEALVRKSYPGESPIGRTIFCPFDAAPAMTIIGVVGDVRQFGPASQPQPECYMPYQQHQYGTTLSIVVRTTGNPTALSETMRRVARERSPDVPLQFTTMEALISENVAAPRFRSVLFGLFAGIAVCLAMAGVYGVMAYAVGHRSSEIGLRIALGASTGSLLRLILGQGLILAVAGLGIGLAASVAGTRLLTSMLFQVRPNEPLVYLAVTILLGIVTIAASYIPARRAARIDPLTAIRQE
ncbi:MAG TPA: ABC transporter permease [Bryobacteraceae bacterium]|nr:ABC transporter permease [Bryobacteraceae bacterium]